MEKREERRNEKGRSKEGRRIEERKKGKGRIESGSDVNTSVIHCAIVYIIL
jgi:hypothetical protein